MNNITTSKINSLYLVGNNRNIDHHTNLYHALANKSYNAVSNCIFEHVICGCLLTSLERLYYLLTTHLSLINYNNHGSRNYALSAKSWAKLLNCSKSKIFILQQKLVEKGYFAITKNQNTKIQDKRNLITPILPNGVFERLAKTSNRYNLEQERNLYYNNFDNLKHTQLEYLDKTKAFIPINYHLFVSITANKDISPLHKIIWLDLYGACCKYYKSTNSKSYFSCIVTYRELMDKHGISKSVLSKALKTLQKHGFITKNRSFIKHSTNTLLEDRRDKSLWQISVTVPKEELEILSDLKDRSSVIDNNKPNIDIQKENIDQKLQINPISNLPYLDKESDINSYIGNYSSFKEDVKELIRFFLNSKDKDDADEIIARLEQSNNTPQNRNSLKTSSNQYHKISDISLSLSDNLKKAQVTDSDFKQEIKVSYTDPEVSKSGLYINKYIKAKIDNIKSNLWGNPKVIFNNFLKELFVRSDSDLATHFKTDDNNHLSEKNRQNRINAKGKAKPKEFNIHSEFIRDKLKTLPKDKADKARRFAYSLVSKGLPSGYASSLTKHELAKELIFHAATWKPTKAGTKTRAQEIDTALSVAWKVIVNGKWQAPLELSKALVLEYEFRHHKQKYQKSGVISSELKTLEIDTEKLLGKWCDLDGKIKSSITLDFDQDKRDGEELCKPDGSDDRLLLQDDGREPEYNISGSSNPTFTLNIKNRERLQEFDNEYCRDHQVHNQSLRHLKDFECNDTILKPSRYDCFFETELPESELIGNNILYNVDLSKLSDSQKHVALRGSDTEIIEITTADNKQYFGKLKTMEVDENGELIMTFIPNSQKEFIKNKDIFSLSTGSIISDLHANKDQLTNYQYNSTESCINNVEFIQEKMQDFKSLDEAVSGIFDKLLYIKSDGS